jgi:hypothetical protein
VLTCANTGAVHPRMRAALCGAQVCAQPSHHRTRAAHARACSAEAGVTAAGQHDPHRQALGIGARGGRGHWQRRGSTRRGAHPRDRRWVRAAPPACESCRACSARRSHPPRAVSHTFTRPATTRTPRLSARAKEQGSRFYQASISTAASTAEGIKRLAQGEPLQSLCRAECSQHPCPQLVLAACTALVSGGGITTERIFKHNPPPELTERLAAAAGACVRASCLGMHVWPCHWPQSAARCVCVCVWQARACAWVAH